MSPHDEQPAPADDLARACHLSGQMSAAQSIAHFGSAIAAPQAAVPAPSEAAPATVATADELIRVARLIEGMKQECGMDPESPTAIRNGRLMSIAAILRQLALPSAERPVAQAGARVPLILAHLAEWESKNGTLCAITPDEWMALMEPIANLAVLESPRMAVNRLRSMQAAAPAALTTKVDNFLQMVRVWVERDGGDLDAALAWMYRDEAPAAGASDLHADFPLDRLADIAEGLEKGYPAEIGIGNARGEGDEFVESTTAYAARFIREYLARHAASSLVAQQAAAQPTDDQRDAEKVALDIAKWFVNGDRPDEWKLKEWAESLDRNAIAKAYEERSGSLAPTQEGKTE